MNENEMNQTEWHDGQGNAVEQNNPAALLKTQMANGIELRD